jgi:hypothetical protein
VLPTVGALAARLPAWRASSIDPAVVLREGQDTHLISDAPAERAADLRSAKALVMASAERDADLRSAKTLGPE